MKNRSCLLAALAVATFGTTTFADNPFDKFVPRGRLLRKLRDDIVGQPKPQEPTPATKPKGAEGAPTPAVRPQGQAATATGSQQRPSPQASRRTQPTRPAPNSSAAQGNAKKGFGMSVVVDKKENVVVTQVVPGGNAAEAGLQRGDVLVEAGGVELTSIEEYQEIRKMLGQGDQLELKFARRGRAATATLQYGQPPSLEEMDQSTRDTPAASTRNSYRNDFSFVPPADKDSRPGMRSVVERPVVPMRSVSTQQHAMGQLRSNTRPAQSQALQQTVTEQQRKIQSLQRQLDQLRRQQGPTGSGVRQRRGR